MLAEATHSADTVGCDIEFAADTVAVAVGGLLLRIREVLVGEGVVPGETGCVVVDMVVAPPQSANRIC